MDYGWNLRDWIVLGPATVEFLAGGKKVLAVNSLFSQIVWTGSLAGYLD